jgi:hypothetical protein
MVLQARTFDWRELRADEYLLRCRSSDTGQKKTPERSGVF